MTASLIQHGRVRRARLGVGGQTLKLPRRIVRHFELPGESGVRVESVERDSPAARAGLARGDVIVALDGMPVADIDALHRLLAAEAIARPLDLLIVRRDRTLTLAITPVETLRRRPLTPGIAVTLCAVCPTVQQSIQLYLHQGDTDAGP